MLVDNPQLDNPGPNRFTPSATYDGGIPGQDDKHARLNCGIHCPFTDVVTTCDEPACDTEGQICTDGGYLCTRCSASLTTKTGLTLPGHCTVGGKSGSQVMPRPRHCSATSANCWVAMTFVGPEGYEDGTEVLDCGSTSPGACQDNNAKVGELCTNLQNVYGTWYVCNNALTPRCRVPPCWQEIVKGTTIRLRRDFQRRRLALTTVPHDDNDL